MHVIIGTIFIALTVAILLPSINSGLLTAKAQDESSSNNTGSLGSTNNTRAVINAQNHTITWIDKTTNKIIKTEKFDLRPGNTTNNETLSTNNSFGNIQNTTTNQNISSNMQNMTTKDNLTTRLNALAGK